MNLQGDGDAFMRHLAKQIEDMGVGAPPPPSTPVGIKLPGGLELSPRMQIIAKGVGAAIALLVVPLLRGRAFQRVWNHFYPMRELGFTESATLANAVHFLMKSCAPVVNINHRDRTLKGK